jgi:alpha/beta superfamily hydrolase
MALGANVQAATLLNLEGRLVIPQRAVTAAGVVICHPYPLYDGSMDNNVVYTVSRALMKRVEHLFLLQLPRGETE